MSLRADLELDYCPFCLYDRARLHAYNSNGRHYRAQCLHTDCGALGPRKPTKKEARQAWNKAHRRG